VDIERVDRHRVICIKSMSVPLIVREIHNPGITQVFENLMSPDGQDLRSLQIPPGNHRFTFGLLAHRFREEHGAILIGMRSLETGGAVVNPEFHATVSGGMFLDYISRNPVKIDWKKMEETAQDRKAQGV